MIPLKKRQYKDITNLGGEERKKGAENLFKEIIAENFPT